MVHGGSDEELETHLEALLGSTPVELRYLRMAPSLVRQRNAGVELARGDVVFFADDDAVYLDGYAAAVLAVYGADSERTVGGVQGTVANPGSHFTTATRLANLFLLTRLNGNGTLQASAWPAFCMALEGLAEVEVFSGPAMSYRREVLAEFRFDDALAAYYVGDDFEMAYRVSRRYRLLQTGEARLMHYSASEGPGRSGGRKVRAWAWSTIGISAESSWAADGGHAWRGRGRSWGSSC